MERLQPSNYWIQSRIQAGLHLFTEIDQIFQMTVKSEGNLIIEIENLKTFSGEYLPPDFHKFGA